MTQVGRSMEGTLPQKPTTPPPGQDAAPVIESNIAKDQAELANYLEQVEQGAIPPEQVDSEFLSTRLRAPLTPELRSRVQGILDATAPAPTPDQALMESMIDGPYKG